MGEKMDLLQRRIDTALEFARDYSQIGGTRHKAWVIDQMVRALTPDYEQFIEDYRKGDDGESNYSWDEGVAP